MSNLPIYRAKKINSDKYVIGQYIETEFSNEEYCDIEEQETIIKHCIIKDFRTVHDDYEYCNFDITEIDIATLAIHFPDMLDSQGNKIFASLREDGKGGDILQSRGCKAPCIFNKGFSVRTVVGVCNFYMLADRLKVVGIQE